MRKRDVGIVVVIIITVVVVISLYLVTRPTIRVVDAYCDNNGHFNFSLENLRDEDRDIVYLWTLNEPRGDRPILRGDGVASLRAGEVQDFTIEINVTEEGYTDYDTRFLVMHITVIEDGKTILEYSEQKSTYDWDYSTLPPTPNGD